jgi:hypothetical protein
VIANHMEQRILNGWKEISSHLERGARTAQRWEAQFAMPVHRPASKRRTAVVAFAEELDVWLMENRAALNGQSQPGTVQMDSANLQEALLRLQIETKELSAKLLRLERHLHETANSNGKNAQRRDASAGGQRDRKRLESLAAS